MSDSPSDVFIFSADNTISQHGIDVEKLNQIATEVQTQLKSGFGDYCEKGSRGDIRHLQMPKFFDLLDQVHTLNGILPKILNAFHRGNNAGAENMALNNSGEARLGGKTKTLAAQMQAMQEQMEKLATKNEELHQGLRTATTDAKEACRQTESLQQETEMQRKDITRLEKKTKEFERRGSVAEAPPVDLAPLEKQVTSLRQEVEAASTAAARAESSADTVATAQRDGHASHIKDIEEMREVISRTLFSS